MKNDLKIYVYTLQRSPTEELQTIHTVKVTDDCNRSTTISSVVGVLCSLITIMPNICRYFHATS